MIEKNWHKISGLIVKQKKIIISGGVVLILLLICATILFSSKKDIVISSGLTPYSSIDRNDGRTIFSLTTQKDYLYKSKTKKGLDAVMEFLKANPVVGGDKLFPDAFYNNTNVTRQEIDSQDKYLIKNKIILTNEHYFFNQKINDIPVYGAAVVVHLRNNDEVYASTGNISTSKNTTAQKISDEKAKSIAITQAVKDSGSKAEFFVEKFEKVYINKKILGISNDPINYIALEVDVASKGKPTFFRTHYFVSLTGGDILYSESQIHEVLNRNIYNCQSGNCVKVRSEGGPATGDVESDNVYTFFKTVYDYYFNTFNRDSYDNAGASYEGYVHVPAGMYVNGNPYPNPCPNAQWDGSEMIFCTGLVLLDVTGHELTHAITFATAGLDYHNESGALNEAVSDIFGSAMDNNWDIGEDLTPGAGLPVPLRSMSNPPLVNQPDKLSTYLCTATDSGGVHINSGIINKAFFLMTDGGNFNGCTINGIGRDKSHPVVYQALTKYLTVTSNFKDAYTTFLQACGDLYGASSSECDNVNRAMQSVEIDQQLQGQPQSPICMGASLQPATCASSGSPSPVPPTGTPTSTPTPTLRPGETPTLTPSPTGSSSPTATPTPIGGGFQKNGTPTPTPDQYFTCKPDPNCAKNKTNIQLCPLVCTPQ